LATGALYEAASRRHDWALAVPGRLVDVGGYRLRLYKTASVGPSVVILPGAGDCADSWTFVRGEVGTFATVASYDRAGLGWSEDGPPPTLDRCLTELGRLLHEVPGPYVLVGHSLGSLFARLYALRHRDEVVGLILVDATPEAVADDPGVKVGFMVTRAAAAVFKALGPFGLMRLLLECFAMPAYPEQRQFRAVVTEQDYRRWIAAVCRDFAGAACQELASVITSAKQAQLLTADLRQQARDRTHPHHTHPHHTHPRQR
jgi:pimeloyl-ACP methyl ester carboxylesterase